MSKAPPAFAIAFACWLAGVIAAPAQACLNTIDSQILFGTPEEVAGALGKLQAKYDADPSLAHTNDLAVGRLMARRNAEALVLLRDAEARFPGKAIVAANLGTAYELSGDNEQALRWIREGVRRDPQEHFGSEWLHVKILEAKVALAQDPAWLHTHTVLGADFGPGDEPVMPSSLPADEAGRARTAEQVGMSIEYQLHERRRFVEPPDPVVADLYAALGDLAMAAGKTKPLKVVLWNASESYEEALRYGPAFPERIERRKLAAEAAEAAEALKPGPALIKPQAAPAAQTWVSTRLAAALGLLLAVAAAILVARRRLRKP